MDKLTYNIKQYSIKPTTKGGYILTNESEKLLIHKSLLASSSSKHSPYCLKDIQTGKHITGMFMYDNTEVPTYYYIDNNKEYIYTIVIDESDNKAIHKKNKYVKKH